MLKNIPMSAIHCRYAMCRQRYWFITRIILILVMLVLCVSCNSNQEKPEADEVGNGSGSGATLTNDPVTVASLLETAQTPVIAQLTIKKPEDRYGHNDFNFRAIGTKELAELNASEMLLAFVSSNGIPNLDLVANSESFTPTEAGIAFKNKFGWTKVPILYSELVYFADYYREFMATNPSPLRRQAAAAEFRAELMKVQADYHDLVRQTQAHHYLLEFDDVTATEVHFNVNTNVMTIPLDATWSKDGNAMIQRLVSEVHGSAHCSGSAFADAVKIVWARNISNLKAASSFIIEMDIDAAEALIAATNAHPGRIQFIVKPGGVAQARCGTTNISSLSVTVLGMRLVVKTSAGEQYYDMLL